MKPSSDGTAEIYDKKEESTFSYDFASPVASFFKESRRQVERYFRGNTNEIDETNIEKEIQREGKLETYLELNFYGHKT